MSLDNLPVEWLSLQLKDIGNIFTGKTPSSKDATNFEGDIPFIKPGDLANGGYIFHTSTHISPQALEALPNLPVNSIMVTCIGNMGKVGINTKVSATNQQINSIVPFKEFINYKYTYYYCLTLKNWLERESSATTIAIVNKGRFSEAPIPLPPLAEQQEIVRQLDVMLAQVEQIKARLDAIPAILKKFRQSVLADAVSGKLTEADVSNWTEVTVNDLVNIVNGKSFPSSDYSAQGIKLLRPGNLHVSGKVKWTDKNTIYLPTVWKEKRSELLLKEGALLMNLTAQSLADEFLGRVCILEKADEDILLNQRISSFESKLNYDVRPYLFYVFKSPQFRSYVDTLDTGTLIKHLNIKDIKTYKLKLPPESEQMQIVTLLKSFIKSASRTEELVSLAKKRANLLTQAILAKAFSGELTAEWREQHQDLITGVNSAESLLAKIQAEREVSKPVKKTRVKKEA